MRVRAGIGIVFLALAGLVASPAGAQPACQASQPSATIAPAGYDTLVDQALRAYDAHNFAEARALLTQAHALYPNACTLRMLGMAEFELKNYSKSIQRLEAALSATVQPLAAELRNQTEELLARARTFVARYELCLLPAPSQAQVLVDGVPVELAVGQALTLNLGEHVLQVRASGYQEAKRALSVKGGEARRIVIELQRRTQPPAARTPLLATSATPAESDAHTLWSSPWLWTVVDAVVVGGVLTAILLAQPQSEPKKPVSGDVGVRGLVQTLSWR